MHSVTLVNNVFCFWDKNQEVVAQYCLSKEKRMRKLQAEKKALFSFFLLFFSNNTLLHTSCCHYIEVLAV